MPEYDAGKGTGERRHAASQFSPQGQEKAPSTPLEHCLLVVPSTPFLRRHTLSSLTVSPCAREKSDCPGRRAPSTPGGRRPLITRTMPRTIRHGLRMGRQSPLHAARRNPGHRRPRVEPRLATPGHADRAEDWWRVPASCPSEGSPDGCSGGLGQSWGGEPSTAARGSEPVGPGDLSGTSRAVIPVPGPIVPPCRPMRTPRPRQTPAHWWRQGQSHSFTCGRTALCPP